MWTGASLGAAQAQENTSKALAAIKQDSPSSLACQDRIMRFGAVGQRIDLRHRAFERSCGKSVMQAGDPFVSFEQGQEVDQDNVDCCGFE